MHELLWRLCAPLTWLYYRGYCTCTCLQSDHAQQTSFTLHVQYMQRQQECSLEHHCINMLLPIIIINPSFPQFHPLLVQFLWCGSLKPSQWWERVMGLCLWSSCQTLGSRTMYWSSSLKTEQLQVLYDCSVLCGVYCIYCYSSGSNL